MPSHAVLSRSGCASGLPSGYKQSSDRAERLPGVLTRQLLCKHCGCCLYSMRCWKLRVCCWSHRLRNLRCREVLRGKRGDDMRAVPPRSIPGSCWRNGMRTLPAQHRSSVGHGAVHWGLRWERCTRRLCMQGWIYRLRTGWRRERLRPNKARVCACGADLFLRSCSQSAETRLAV